MTSGVLTFGAVRAAVRGRRYDSLGVAPHEWTKRPNTLAKNSIRLNVNSAVSPKLDLAINMGYINSGARFINQSSSSSAAGIAYYGSGHINNGVVGLVDSDAADGLRWVHAELRLSRKAAARA